jgi:DNA-directed RNA polymerase II subunit RPB1
MHVAWNDLGAMASQELIDDFSRIMSQWFIINGFSVGMRDIQLRRTTQSEVEGIKRNYLRQAAVLIDGLNSGNYEMARKQILKDAPRGLMETEYQQFESDIYYVLGRCRSEIEELTVKNIGLTEEGNPYDNRFMSMVNSGSKGNKVNLVQIVSMIGQQDMAGARVQDSYRRRPMPFLSKDDFSPAARGFISSSYMAGLSFLEYIYHAMAGRLGVISTSIKTAETGYLQRKLMKRLEDFRTMYDMTVRSNSGMILQYVYGGDSYNGSKIEPQRIDYLTGNVEQLIMTYGYSLSDWERSGIPEAQIADEITAAEQELEILKRDWKYLRSLYKYDLPKSYPCIVNFDRLLKSVRSRLRSAGGQAAALPEERLTPSIVLSGLQALEKELVLPTTETISYYTLRMFFCIMRSKLASKILIIKEDYNQLAFQELLDEVRRKFYKGLVPPGEAVGAIAAQSIGEPSTQMTLDAFHSTGSKATVSGGVPRFKEILSLTKMKTPSATIYLKGIKIPEKIMDGAGLDGMSPVPASVDVYLQRLSKDEQKAAKDQFKIDYIMQAILPIKSAFEYLRLSDMVSNTEFLYIENLQEEDVESVRDIELMGIDRQAMSKWYIKFYLNPDHRPTIESVGGLHGLCTKLGKEADFARNTSFIHSDINIDAPWIMANFNITMLGESSTLMTEIMDKEVAILHTRIRGVTDITKATVREPVKKDIHLSDGRIVQVGSDDYAEASNSVMDAEDYIIDTVGTNLVEILSMPHVDPYRTYSNSVQEMYEMYGIEGARRAIIRETQEVFNNAGVSFDIRHIELLADAMTCRGSLQKIDRSGAKKGDTGPIAVASFEETTTAMCKAAAYGEVDNMKGVSANIVHGQMVKVGTGAFDIYLDEAMIVANALAQIDEEPESDGPLSMDARELQHCHPEMVQFGFAL